jgi:hypothetical protein
MEKSTKISKKKFELSEKVRALNLSKKKLAVYQAYEKGYRVIDGEVDYKGKTRKLFSHYKKLNNLSAYYSFGVRFNTGERVEIYVHQLLAYQKYGMKYLKSDRDVIHIDKDTRNNIEENIKLEI